MARVQDVDATGAAEFIRARLRNGEPTIFIASTADGQAVGFCQLPSLDASRRALRPKPTPKRKRCMSRWVGCGTRFFTPTTRLRALKPAPCCHYGALVHFRDKVFASAAHFFQVHQPVIHFIAIANRQ